MWLYYIQGIHFFADPFLFSGDYLRVVGGGGGQANLMKPPVNLANLTPSSNLIAAALPFSKLTPPFPLTFSHLDRPFISVHKFKRKVSWSPRSATDGNRLNPDDPSGGTRLIRSIQAIRLKIISRLKELKRNLPGKLLSFLVGFYCATVFATMIGQTGDWDVLSAALAVAAVEGIGALMYRAPLPLVGDFRDMIVIFNYWKVVGIEYARSEPFITTK